VVPLSEWIAGPGPDDARWIRVEEPSAAAGARGIALGLAERLDFPPARAEQLALAVTEAASNLVKHARVGTLLLRIGPAADGRGIELVTIDTGPGIADLPAALRDGTSTAGTLGIGLGAIGRIADFSDVYSVPGRGTTLAARFLPRPAPAGTHGHAGDQAAGLAGWAGLTRPISGEHECGDNYAVHWDGAVATAILSDGLGHGPLAAAASRAAIAAMRDGPADEPAALLERAHRQMSGTRGGAVAVVRVEPGWVSFAGLGNVAGWLTSGESRQGLVSVPGICGHQARRLRQFRYERPPGSVVILHSDGLTSRWNIRDLPGLVTRDPLVIAAALLSEAGVHRDDAGVLVLRP
jgi:anti-sigma regulatory factor (Ser/Thr protein kinase)